MSEMPLEAEMRRWLCPDAEVISGHIILRPSAAAGLHGRQASCPEIEVLFLDLGKFCQNRFQIDEKKRLVIQKGHAGTS